MKYYSGYVYIYWDTKEHLYYIGGHYGTIQDSYTCSNTMLKGIINRRPNTIRFRVLQYISGSVEELREVEQYWLNLIKDEELYLSKKPRYFNLKKNSTGGNGSANKGNHNIGGHNRKTWKLISPEGQEIITNKLSDFCNNNNLVKSTLYSAYKKQRPVVSGKCKGWQLQAA